MENITLETIAVVIGFLTLLGSQIGGMFMLLNRMNDQNKRIDDMNTEMNRRFDNVNKRFDDVNNEMNRRFDTMNGEMNRRFDDVNKRFDTMNQRFDETTLLIGGLRDRTGKLEGMLEGFLAGQRDRDAA